MPLLGKDYFTNPMLFDGAVGVGGLPTPFSSAYGSTHRVLTIGGAAGGYLELVINAGDAAGINPGHLLFETGGNTSEKRIAAVLATVTGAVANNKGGELNFYTKADGGALTERLTIDSAGFVKALLALSSPELNLNTILSGPPDDKGSLRIFDRPQALTDPGGIEFQVAASYGHRIVAFDNSEALVFANRAGVATWTELMRLKSGRAILEATGVVGNTAAIFGAGGRGIALIQADPHVGFNAYYSSGWKAIATGAAALIGSSGENLTFYLGPSANMDAALTMTAYLALINTAFYPADTNVMELGKSDKLWEIIWGNRIDLGNGATDYNVKIQRYSAGVGAGPGASIGALRWEPGTNAGTLKLVAYSGTSTTGVTIVDNVGSGN